MKKKKIKKTIIAKGIIVICFLGVIYSSYNIIYWKKSVHENALIKEKNSKNINIIKDKDSDNKEEYYYDIDFESLKKENNDTVAYIKVNNTNIDYIVVKGNDNEYYLSHNFDKKYNIAGWIFADYHNKIDESDKNIVVYGHNTQDGTMFGSLKNILEKSWQEDENNWIITFITELNEYKYRVFSTYSIYPEDYYINTEFTDNQEFFEFVNKIKKRSDYDYNVDVTEDDRILTLSGCINKGAKRVVLHAKLIETKY